MCTKEKNKRVEVEETASKQAKSDVNNNNLIFCNWWLSKKSSCSVNNPAMIGYWEDLRQYIAVGFEPAKDIITLCLKNYTDREIFLYSTLKRGKRSVEPTSLERWNRRRF